MLNKNDLINKARVINFLACLMLGLVVLAPFYAANSLYPITSDDFTYRYICGTFNRIESIGDILESQVVHYMFVNGRFLVHCIVQFFLMVDRCWFEIANTLVYGMLALALCCVNKRFNLLAWVVVAGTFWAIMPNPGSSIFWLTGSINYLWSACGILVFLALLFSTSRKCQIAAAFMALPVGSMHEGITSGIVAALVFYAIFKRERNWIFYVALGLLLAGFLTNACSPGSMSRLSRLSSGQDTGVLALVERYFGAVKRFTCNIDDWWGRWTGFMLWYMTAFIHVYRAITRREWHFLPLSLLIGAAVCLGGSVAANSLYARALFPFCLLSYCAFFLTLRSIACKQNSNAIWWVLLAFAGVLNLCEGPKAVYAFESLKTMNGKARSLAASGAQIISADPFLIQAHGGRYLENVLTRPHETLRRSAIGKTWNIRHDFAVLPHWLAEQVVGAKGAIQELPVGGCMILPDRKHVCLALPRKPDFGKPIKFFAPDEKHVMSWSFCLGSRYYIMFPIFKMDTNVEITYPGGKKETYRVPMKGGQ